MICFLDALKDGNHHDGTALAASLGISRAAIWKIAQRLKTYDAPLESSRQGYRLLRPLVMLDGAAIEKQLTSKARVEVFEKLNSTSDYLMAAPKAPLPHICLTEHQQNGRGRAGRAWASPFGLNLYCSISRLFQKDFSDMAGLSLAVGVLVAKAIQTFIPALEPRLKWPNDIYLDQKKLGGILIDIHGEANGSSAAVIGVGLNVNMAPQDLSSVDGWTSLAQVTGQPFNRTTLAAILLNTLLEGLEIFSQEGLRPFLSTWADLDYLKNKQTRLFCGKILYSGVAKGVTPLGQLCLELPTGLKAFSFGDTELIKPVK